MGRPATPFATPPPATPAAPRPSPAPLAAAAPERARPGTPRRAAATRNRAPGANASANDARHPGIASTDGKRVTAIDESVARRPASASIVSCRSRINASYASRDSHSPSTQATPASAASRPPACATNPGTSANARKRVAAPAGQPIRARYRCFHSDSRIPNTTSSTHSPLNQRLSRKWASRRIPTFSSSAMDAWLRGSTDP
jgi:hypothetical protein